MPVTYFGPETVSKELFNKQLVTSPPPVISVDVETVSLKERMPIGFAIATSPAEAWYFRIYPEPDPELELIWPLLANPNIKKVFHNAMFDLRAFPLIGHIDRSNIADTNVMARLLGRTDTKLLELAPEVGRETQDAHSLIVEYGGKTMLDVPPDVVAAKCANDTQVTLALYYEYVDSIDPQYFKVEMNVIPILIDMSLRGLAFNEIDRARLEDQLEKEVAYYRQICEEEDLNPASNQQVGYILAKRGNFLPFTKGRKQLKVDVDELEFLDDPIAAIVLNFRTANKLLTTYIRPLAGEDRIYCLHPSTRVLKADLSWVAIGSLTVGDELVGIDTEGDGRNWKMRRTPVRATNRVIDKAYLIVTDKCEDIIVNGKHPWLCTGMEKHRSHKGSRLVKSNQWVRTEELKPGYEIKCSVLPWEYDATREGGWMAGLLDGEGWADKNCTAGFSQNAGGVLNRGVEYLEHNDYIYHSKTNIRTPQVWLSMYQSMRLLGSTRPTRLLLKADNIWNGKRPLGESPARVLLIEELGECELVDIETDTHTFIAEGLFTHNTEYNLDPVVGRLASSNMNMQNIPGKDSPTGTNARHIFIPDSGVFTTGDFSQEHLRILMHFSGDREMQRVYYEGEHGGDIHAKTARELGISRHLGKTINYAIPYGATPWAVSINAKIKDLKKCARFIDGWFDTYPDAAEWIRGAQEYGLSHGKALPTLFGRDIAIPDEYTKYGKLNTEAMKRKAVNYPILGSDGEIMKRALIVCKRLPLAVTVHDSITADGDIEFPIETLETLSPVRIPFEVTKTERWE